MWSTSLIRKTIIQPNYYGLVAWGRTRAVTENGRQHRTNIPPEKWLMAEGDFEAPFTPDDWQRTLAEMQRRRNQHPRRRGTPYLLTGILWCADCGTGVRGSYNCRRPYYRCDIGFDYNRRVQHPHYRSVDRLHRLVGEKIREFALSPDNFQAIIEGAEVDNRVERERTLLLEQVDEIAQRRRRWMDAYDTGAIALTDFSDRVMRIDQDQGQLTTRLARLDDTIHQAKVRQDWIDQSESRIAQLQGEIQQLEQVYYRNDN